MAPGKMSLHSSCEGEHGIVSSRGRGIGPQAELKGEYRCLSGVAAGNPGFPRHVTVNSGRFSGCFWEVRNILQLEGLLGTPLGSVQRKRASSRVEVGKTGLFLTSGGKLSVPLELGLVSLETSGVS